MKKFLHSALPVLTACCLTANTFSAVTLCGQAYDETGAADMSQYQMNFGDYTGNSASSDYIHILADNISKNYLLGDYLDNNNKAVYAAMAELVNPSTEKFTVRLPEPVVFTTSDINAGGEDFSNAVFSACASAKDAVSFDMPEIFWLDQNNTSVSVGSMPYKYNRRTGLYTCTIEAITFTPAYYSGFADIDEVLEYKTLLEDAINSFSVEGNTNAEKLKNIHDKIADFTYYDIEGRFSGSALSSFVVSGAVCEGYAKGFKMICDKIGIPCVCVFGNYDETNRTAHMWNYVLMEDDCWYAVDLTWDDCDGEDGIDVKYEYFLKGSDDFNKNHTPTESYFLSNLKYPEIALWNYGENPAFITTTTATAITTKQTTTTALPDEYEYGDLNHDGKISIADLVYVSSHVLAIESAEYSCDLNQDNRTDVYDVIIMRRILADIMLKNYIPVV